MANERTWSAVSQAFVADSTVKGLIKVESSNGFKVKARVIISSDTQPKTALEIKAIQDEFTIEVGPAGSEMLVRTDVSAYTVADNASIFQERQPRPKISMADFGRAVYEEEPAVAIRVIPVSEAGELVDESIDGIVPSEYDDVKLTRDINTDVQQAAFFNKGKLLWTVKLTRDINTDVIEARRFNP